jgi:hypothetical protein
MATKKQKREAAAIKRTAFLKEERELGLASQRLDQTIREKQRERSIQAGRELNERLQNSLENQVRGVARKFAKDVRDSTGDETLELHIIGQYLKFLEGLTHEMAAIASETFEQWNADNP